MSSRNVWLTGLWATCALAATTASTNSIASVSSGLSTVTGGSFSSSFTGTYDTNTVQSTVALTGTVVTSGSSSGSTTQAPGTTSIQTLLVGGVGAETLSIINGTVTISPNATASATGTSSSTSTAAMATNTQACNGYAEFCNRKYSNITEVCAHNSAFVRTGNVAANQALTIPYQLNDGIRMIQGETHYVNDTMYSCHTSCDLLNAGTFEAELTTVREWVQDHPYDVVTILIVNSDYVDVGNYTAPFENSGLTDYVYLPPKVPMHLDDWPTLSEMILSGKRVVVFMDYQANHKTVPYILDEFTHMWETPFSPEDVNFPCTVQRPPTLTNQTVARDDYMYLANHNLNQEISLLGESLLLPATSSLNVTNAAGLETGMLGAMTQNCTETWNRAPNFLLVDYYNVGSGSVFEVAAKYNNVTYNGNCCGTSGATSGAMSVSIPDGVVLGLVLLAVSSFFIML